jgi:outer membrane protein assembly factor BamB
MASMNTIRAFSLLVVWLITSAVSASDWPTLHRDNQRSGHTAEFIAGPYERKWFRDFHDEMIASRVEAIVAEGKVFVGTFAGKVHALNVEDGSEVWTAAVAGPVGHSPTYHNGHLYVGSEGGAFNRGFITCLRASDGKEVWRYEAPAGVWVAPACDGDTVYAGDRSGVFHAIDATAGTRRWQVLTGAMILAPASISADGKKIVFASEDMHVYCVDANGKELWKSPKCGGLSLRDHAPTIWKDLVIVRTNPVAAFHQALGMSGMKVLGETQKKIPVGPDDFVIQDKWGTYSLQYTEPRMAAERKAVTDYLRNHPEERTLWAFQLADGKEPWLAPVPYTCGLHNTGAPPTFDPSSGDLYVWSASALSNYSAGVPGGAAVLAKLDRRTGLAHTVWHKNLRGGKEALGWAAQFCAPADETQTISLMGNIVLNTHQGIIGGLDLKSLRWHTVYSARDSYAGIFGPIYVGSYSPEGRQKRADFMRQGYLLEVPNEWHGPDRSIVAIAERRFFWIAGSQLVCLGGPDTPKTATGGVKNPPAIKRVPPGRAGGGNLVLSIDAAPRAGTVKKQLTAEDLKPLLDPVRRPAKQLEDALANDVRKRLDAAVVELIDDGPWAPLVLQLGITGEERHFWRSADVLQAVALALPHLSAAVQSKAKAYLDAQFALGVPLTNPVRPPDGKRREAYDLGTGATRKFASSTPKYGAGVDDLYAVWAYAEYADGWNKVLPELERIEQLFGKSAPIAFNPDAKEGIDAERLNARTAGTLAYVRMMRRAGKLPHADRGMAQLMALATERVHHERVDRRLVRPTRLLHGANLPRYIGLVPELGALVKAHAGEELTSNVRDLMRDLPVWHQAFGERLIGGENYISPPALARGLFAALADGVQAPPGELARFLDQPWCKADLYFIEKCASLLRGADGIR